MSSPNDDQTPTKLDGTPAVKSGRPPKLTRELIERIAGTVRVGCYLDSAARVHGVAKATYHVWMKRGHEQKRGIYRDFVDALLEAQAQADERDHAIIANAAMKGEWKAAVEHLRLRNPTRYNVKRQELTGPDGKPIGVAVAPSTEASLLALFQKLAGENEESQEAPAEPVKAP